MESKLPSTCPCFEQLHRSPYKNKDTSALDRVAYFMSKQFQMNFICNWPDGFKFQFLFHIVNYFLEDWLIFID